MALRLDRDVFRLQGLFVKKNEFPERIEFMKKGSFFAVHDINTTHKLVVSISYVNDSASIELMYSFPQCTGSLSVKSIEELINDVDGLAMKLQIASSERSTVPDTRAKRPIGSPDAVVLRKKISFCPYCGKRLGDGKTPHRCPTCRERLTG